MYNPRKLLRCLTQFRNRRNTGRSRIGNSHFQTFCLCLSHPASKEEGVLSISRRRSKYCATYLRVCNIVQGSTNWGGWILFAPFNWEWNWGIIYVFNIFYLKLRDLKSNYTLFFLRTRFLHVHQYSWESKNLLSTSLYQPYEQSRVWRLYESNFNLIPTNRAPLHNRRYSIDSVSPSKKREREKEKQPKYPITV